jgi:hypothetical protein
MIFIISGQGAPLTRSSPPGIDAAAGTAQSVEVDRQDHNAQRQHPKTQDREKRQHPAEQEPTAEQDAQKPRPGKPDRMTAETQPVACRPCIAWHSLKSVQEHPV